MAYFIRETVAGDGGNNKVIRGLAALKMRWEMVMQNDGKQVKSYSDLALFQVWDYLLSPAQRKVLDATTKRLLGAKPESSASSGAHMVKKQKKKDTSVDDMAAARQLFK